MLEALVEGARRGLVDPDDYILQPGALKWKRAKDVAALWATPLEEAEPEPSTAKTKEQAWGWSKWIRRR
jgi:hypothetical protein